jgi:hypothetical protein
VRPKISVVRIVALCACLLTVSAACSSSHKSSNAPTTTSNAPTSTTDPNITPNSIPYAVGERTGLPGGWIVTVAKVRHRYSAPGLPALGTRHQYVALDITMVNQTSAAHTVNADRLLTLVDGLHKAHFVIAQPGRPNGIDGAYPPGRSRSGRVVFSAPVGTDLGLVLYGPRIGTQISYFSVDPPSPPPS